MSDPQKVRAKSAEYWRDRMVRLVEEQYDKADDASEEAAMMYRKAAEELKRDISLWYARLAENNGISLAEAMKLLDDEELEEFHWTVEQYIKAGKENAIDQKWMKELENASAKVHIRRLEAIELQCKQQAQLAADKEKKQIADLLQRIFLSTYYGTGFEVSKRRGFLIDFAVVPSDEVNSIIYTPWAKDGKDFSARIWADRDKLTVELRKIIEQGLMTGKSVEQMSKQVQDAMGATASNAKRIIQTETAAVIEKSHEKMYQEFGAKNVMILATLDMKTCATCGALDHKVIPMKTYEMGVTIPPFHPRCRCTTIFDDVLVFDDDTRLAKDEDGNYYEVPADMSYEDWKNRLKTFKESKTAKNINTKNDIIKANQVISGHKPAPKKYKPNAVIDRLGDDGKVETRSFYNEEGLKEKDLTNHGHKNPKTHPYGENGEHVHEYVWNDDGSLNRRLTRELTNKEREENSDIL